MCLLLFLDCILTFVKIEIFVGLVAYVVAFNCYAESL